MQTRRVAPEGPSVEAKETHPHGENSSAATSTTFVVYDKQESHERFASTRTEPFVRLPATENAEMIGCLFNIYATRSSVIETEKTFPPLIPGHDLPY